MPFLDEQTTDALTSQLEKSTSVKGIYFLKDIPLQSSSFLMHVAEKAKADYVLLQLKPVAITLGAGALERMMAVANDTGAAMVYADRFEVKNGVVERHPVIDYQEGSLRDDFDFGSLVLIPTSLLHQYATSDHDADYRYAGFYDFRLFLSREGQLFHLNEFLYTEEERDLRASGEKQFDYVNPANREVQIEMEQVCTAHLREVGALVDTTQYQAIDFEEQDFEFEASVIIPVFNRAKTIKDAVESALSQKTSFNYNVIVVDNHSTDGTSDILSSMLSCHDNKHCRAFPLRPLSLRRFQPTAKSRAATLLETTESRQSLFHKQIPKN